MPRASSKRVPVQVQAKPSRPAALQPTQPAPAKTDAIVATSNGKASHEIIAAKAYEIWCARGGNATVNWLEAESIVNGKQVAAPI